MKHLQLYFIFAFTFGYSSQMNAQEQTQNKLMYTLKAGVMPHSVHKDIEHDEDATESKIDWMAEFGLEIPVGKNWNIETALRYKSKSFIAYEDYNFARLNWNEDYLAKHPELDHDSRIYRTYSGASILELPIRTTYKLQLNDNFAFHLGVGPYASINLTGKPFDAAKPFKSSALTIGIESAVALYYKNVSIGATYNNPVFYQSNKVKDNNTFMITIGFRFSNKVWRSIGRGIEKTADSGVLDALGNALQQTAQAFGEGTSQGTIDMSNPYSSSYSTSGAGAGAGSNYITQYNNWAKRAEANYNSLVNLGVSVKNKNGKRSGATGQGMSPSNYTRMKQSLREAQREMKNIRIKAQKAGVTIQESPWETATVNY